MATVTEGRASRLFPSRDQFDAPRGRVLPWRGISLVLGLIGASAAAGIALAGSYAVPAVVSGVTVSAAAASVLVTLTLRTWWGALPALLIGLPLPLLWVVVLANALPGAGGGVIQGTVEALIGSGASILTSASPTPATVDTLTLPLLATWLTGVASALAWRAGRGAVAPLPGVVLLAGAAVLNGPAAPPSFVAVGILVASTGFLLVGSPRETDSEDVELPGLTVRVRVLRRGDTMVGRMAASTVVVVCIALVAVVVAPILLASWDARPADPREELAPPMEPQDTLNPLSYLSAWAAEPDQHLMSVRTDDDVTLRWVTLGEFTGTTWLTDEGYRVADQTLPEPVPPPPNAQTTSVEISVGDALPGPWAPVVGAPRTVGVPSPGYDPMSGTVVTRDGGIAAMEYEVTGEVPEWRPNELEGATTPVEEVYDRYRQLPSGTPTVVNEVVAEVAAGDTSPYQRANALAEYLRESHTFNPETAGGHGYASLAAVLATPGEEGGGGTSEQFASAFAVLARAAGLPSRVAVGFDGTAEADGASSDERRVLTGDAVAWGEVYFDGVGWVPFSVTPGVYDTETAEDPASAAAPDEPDAADDEPAEDDSHDLTAPASDTEAETPRSWLLLGGLAALALTTLLAVPLSRWIRQERRLRSTPAPSRVLGAWHELHDTLRQCSVQLTSGDTVFDVVAAARRVAGGPNADSTTAADLLALERAVNTVSFGPETRSVDAEADGVVDGTRRQLRVLRRTRGRVRRLLWWFDPRPLLWRHARTRPRGSST